MEFFNERGETLKPKGAFFLKLRATAAIAMLLASTAPTWALGQSAQQGQQSAPAAQGTAQANPQKGTDPALQGLPPEPAPKVSP